MEIALIVGMSILLAIGLGSFVITYSYGVYTKAKIFSKPKYPIIPVACASLILICLAIFLGLMCSNKSESNKYFYTYLGLSIGLIVLACSHIIWLTCIYCLNKNNKIDYLNIKDVDWKAKEQELISKSGDIEYNKQVLANKNPHYYTQMLQYYKSIVLKLSQKNISYSESVADIVTFNDLFTHKWSAKMNILQLQLTYKFCSILQQTPGQK